MPVAKITAELTQFVEGITISSILTYITGLDRVPAAGFQPETSVTFEHALRLPYAGTCSNQLILAVNDRAMSLPFFLLDMVIALCNGITFTKA